MADLMFEVAGRNKSEKITKEGNLETTFKVSLRTPDKKYKLTITDASAALLTKYPLNSDVRVKIGKSDQSNLLSEEQMREEVSKIEDEKDQ